MSKTMSLAEIVSKFKTKDHFYQAYTKKGKVLPNDLFIGWNYIKQILIGDKLLLDQSQLDGFSLPPKYY